MSIDPADWRSEATDDLLDTVLALPDRAAAERFFRDLCTPAELQALVDRWQVVELLQQDLPYRKIHDLTGVSVTTIGRVARFLHDGFGGYETALARTRKLRGRRANASSQ